MYTIRKPIALSLYGLSFSLIGLMLVFSSSFAQASTLFEAWPDDQPINIYTIDLTLSGHQDPEVASLQARLSDYVEELKRVTQLPLTHHFMDFHEAYEAFEADPNGLITFLAKTEPREKNFTFYPVFSNPYVYKVRLGDTPIFSLEELGDKSIGVFGLGSAPYTFLSQRLPLKQIHVFDSLALLESALSTQLVDVIFTNFNHFGFANDAWSKVVTIPRLAIDTPDDLSQGSFVVHKTSPHMIELLEAIMSVSPSLPTFQALKRVAESAQLTPQIQQYLMDTPAVVACLSNQGAPFQWINSNGLAGGTFPAFLQRLMQGVGLQVNFKEVPLLKDQLPGVLTGQCDIAWDVVSAENPLNEFYSVPFYETRYLVVANRDYKKNLPKGKKTLAVSHIMAGLYPSIESMTAMRLVPVEGFQQVSALLTNEVDFALIDINFWRNKADHYTEQGIVVIDEIDLIGRNVLYIKDPTLLTLLNMAIEHSSSDVASNLLVQTASQQIVAIQQGILSKTQLWLFVLVFLGIVGLLLFFLRLSQKADAAHTLALEHTKRFLANMSHELRTPMNSILGMSELLSRDDKLDELQSEQAKIINRSGQHMLRLLNDVLDMSKIEAGEISLEAMPVDIRQVIDDVAIQWRVPIENKGMRFECPRKMSLANPYRVADPTRLLQIMSNLVSNAAKFTHTGYIAVDVIQQANGHLLLRVEDSGIGIAKAFQKEIFKRFKQADDSINRRFGGTGLGLSISRSLVQLMGGDLTFTSKVNQGTCFELILPLPVADEYYEHQQQEEVSLIAEEEVSPSSAVQPLASGSRKLRLLVVDDVATNNFVLSIMLQRQLGDVLIDEATSVAEAESLLLKHRYHAVFTDINMPEKTGIDLLHAIKNHTLQGVSADMPVVACTGDEFSLESDRLFDASIVKPVAIEPLKHVLASVGLMLNKPEASSPSQTATPAAVSPANDISQSFLTHLAKLGIAHDWAETVVNPCLAYLEIMIDDMRAHLARGELIEIQNIAFHFNTIGSLLGDEELKVIARRLINAKPLQTPQALECFIAFSRRVKYHQARQAKA